MVTVNFFRTLEINQRLVAIQEVFVGEKNDLILVRTQSFVAF